MVNLSWSSQSRDGPTSLRNTDCNAYGTECCAGVCASNIGRSWAFVRPLRGVGPYLHLGSLGSSGRGSCWWLILAPFVERTPGEARGPGSGPDPLGRPNCLGALACLRRGRDRSDRGGLGSDRIVGFRDGTAGACWPGLDPAFDQFNHPRLVYAGDDTSGYVQPDGVQCDNRSRRWCLVGSCPCPCPGSGDHADHDDGRCWCTGRGFVAGSRRSGFRLAVVGVRLSSMSGSCVYWLRFTLNGNRSTMRKQ